MAFQIERQLALSEDKIKCLSEMRDQAYHQVAKIMMFTSHWQGLTEKFETMRTEFVEKAKELALQERKLLEHSNLLDQREKEAEIKSRRTEEEIQVKEKELGSIKTQLQDSVAEFHLREKQLNECNIELNSKIQKVEECNKEFSLKKAELGLVKTKLEECHQDLSLKNNQLCECSYELKMKEKGLDSIKTQIQHYSAEIDSKQKCLTLVQEEIEKCNGELISKNDKLDECNREIHLKRNDLSEVQKSLEQCTAELQTVISIKNCEKELEFKRTGLKKVWSLIEGSKRECDLLNQKMSRTCKLMEKTSKELKSKELELSSIKELIGEYNEELEDKEKKYHEIKNSVDEVVEKLKSKETELKSIEKSLNENSAKLYAEQEKLDAIKKEMENEEKKLEDVVKHHEDCEKELELDKEQLRSVKLRIENSNVELSSIKNLILECSGKLESKERNLDAVKKSLEVCCNELMSTEVQQGVIHVMCCENLRELQEQKRNHVSLKRAMQEREEELQNREKLLEEKVRMMESAKQQKRDEVPLVKIEQLDPSHTNPACSSSANSHFNEKSPEFLLDDIAFNPNLTIDEISDGLEFSPDPAKLVLDLMRGSYFQFQDNGSAGFDDSLMTNIVLLLERLMKISPKISLQVKEIALQQGSLWKDYINSKTENSIEVLAFLMFLAVYGLASYFRRDEILILIKAIVRHKQAPEICQALCFIEEIAGLTANLIQTKQFREAARFSKTFELSSKFLPQNILKNYLETIKMDVLQSANGNSFQELFKKIDREATLKTFWQCVVDCQLESMFPLEGCVQYIVQGVNGHPANPVSDSSHMSQQRLEGHKAQQQMQSRNPYMVNAANPSTHPFLDTGKRPRLESLTLESHQGSIPPRYVYRAGFFHGPN